MDWTILDEIAATGERHMKDPVQEILFRRGIHHPVDFLSPDMAKLRNPRKLKDMDWAIALTKEAMFENKKIRIFGDYDADGIDATTILVLGFRQINYEVDFYIPERHEGYGLNAAALLKCKEDDVDLIITCDTGITAVNEVKYAQDLGMKIIVTDHHQPQDELPKCPIINPQQEDCNYGFAELSGSGVAFQFINALYEKDTHGSAEKLWNLLPFAAIGTIADVMPLIDDNRILVANGLAVMPHTKNYGLKHLLHVSGLENKQPTTMDIGFKVAPVINATGRLAMNREGDSVSPADAVNMFLDKSRLRTYRIASELGDLNKYRQEITKEFTKLVVDHIESDPMIKNSKVMVVLMVDLPEGIVGLIAGKLKEHYNRPVLLMTNAEPGIWKGSGRSITSYDMFTELNSLGNFFEKFGGHAQACGFSLKEENIMPLTAVLNNCCELSTEDITKTKEIDYVIDPQYVTMDFARALQSLEPYGKGNPKPLFAFMDAEILGFRKIGKEKQHLAMTIKVGGYHEFECICFHGAKKLDELGFPPYINVSFFPEINEYNGRRQLQLKIDDFCDSTTAKVLEKAMG